MMMLLPFSIFLCVQVLVNRDLVGDLHRAGGTPIESNSGTSGLGGANPLLSGVHSCVMCLW